VGDEKTNNAAHDAVQVGPPVTLKTVLNNYTSHSQAVSRDLFNDSCQCDTELQYLTYSMFVIN